MRYKLVKAEDGIVWVSIQPLMADIEENLDKIKQIPTIQLNDEDNRGLNLKIIGLESIYQFLGALLTEQQLVELKEQHDAQIDRPTTH